MKTIGIFTSGYGHESIALAIADKIKQKAADRYQVKVCFDHRHNLNAIYNSVYRFSPGSFGASFKIIANLTKNNQIPRKLIETSFTLGDGGKIANFIKKNKIDICISTYFISNPSIEEVIAKNKLPFLNIITDPRTIQPLNLSQKADVNFIFDQVNNTNGLIKIKKSGWFVRSEFEQKYRKNLVREKLKINQNLTILVVSGSEGANAVLKILPSIINCSQKVNFIIACGKNKFLYNNILGIKQSLKKFSSSQAEIIPLAYTKNLHLYMQAADLVIGKAGPNTLFESVACGTPFFAITHIHGQEDGNLDLIKDYHLGIVEENTQRANQKLSRLIQNPQKIQAFKQDIQKIKKYNQNSINILLKTIDNLGNVN